MSGLRSDLDDEPRGTGPGLLFLDILSAAVMSSTRH
jgi:hypothetical protein